MKYYYYNLEVAHFAAQHSFQHYVNATSMADSRPPEDTHRTWLQTLDPHSFFHPDLHYFLFYNGSLTSPPCSDQVRFLIFPNPMKIFESTFILYHRMINAVSSIK